MSATKASPAVKALRGYDETFLECRRGNLGHIWRTVGFYRDPHEPGVVCRVVRCDRCESERVDRWEKDSAERLAPRYHYAEGYHIGDTNGEYVDTYMVRAEVMRRATVFANEDAMLASLTNGRRH
jgi:hypothetical protein